MNKKWNYCLVLSAILLSGCVVRTYPVTKDRLDQDLSMGNRGYLKGQPPVAQERERKATRRTQVVEIELRPLIKFEKTPKAEPQKIKPVERVEEPEVWGNRGYIEQSVPAEIREPGYTLQRYTVQRGDTLQKISKKFYGTTKKWTKIYEMNKDVLKGPNKIYPGQVINIPLERETKPQGYLK